ncbi:two-component response regulator family protein [hydrothermal vent metagenome]|uniref:Two-component response regulator family protein n=1 Tax=hydrothermal vent metagenome TaxID=652676 RepID=A0A1W1CZK5_9ZZZZ
MNEEKLTMLKNFTLLLVDDEEALLNKLHIVLSLFFKEVILAKNGQEALDIYHNQSIDMVISDYSMPLMSGYELCKAIRTEDRYIPLVIMSNYSDKEKLLSVIPLALAQYLIKPIDYATLTATLLSMIEQVEVNGLDIIEINACISYNRFRKILIDKGEEVRLSNSEISLLELFVMKKNQIVSIAEIHLCLNSIEIKSKQAIKSLIYRLRKKVGKESILNIPAYGYIFKSQC